MQRVVVVGAGVIGLSTALHLLERFPGALDLTVVSEKFSPDVTSDRAGAGIFPLIEEAGPPVGAGGPQGGAGGSSNVKQSPRNATADQRTKAWAKATLQRFQSIYSSEENAEVEICLEQGYILLDSLTPDPWYKDEVFGFRHVKLDSVEAKLFHFPPGCVDVWAFGTYLVETSSYLRWLMDKVKQGGGRFEQRKVSSFDELSPFDIIINCTGLGSRDLLDDKLLHPVRGQVVLVNAPWLKHWVHSHMKEALVGVLPRARSVVLGGSAEAHNWNDTPDPDTAESILKKCQSVIPSLRGAEVIGGWAGLRPLRDPIRLDSAEGPAGSLLVHCYGHGGQGVVLSWGCAVDIGNIVQQKLAKIS